MNNNNIDISFETKRAELDYVTKIYRDIDRDNNSRYINSYECENGDEVKIQVTIVKYNNKKK